jgi:hypothetical protein
MEDLPISIVLSRFEACTLVARMKRQRNAGTAIRDYAKFIIARRIAPASSSHETWPRDHSFRSFLAFSQ